MPGVERRADLVEAQRAGRDVGEAAAEQQRGRPDGARDQVLEAALERRLAVDVEGAQDVQRDREQLERDEQGDEAVGRGEDAHPGAGEAEQRVVLGDAVGDAARAPAEQDAGHAARAHDGLDERRVAVGRELAAEGRVVAVVPEVPGRRDPRP